MLVLTEPKVLVQHEVAHRQVKRFNTRSDISLDRLTRQPTSAYTSDVDRFFTEKS